MPAPPAGLLAAMRKGSATRHCFFYMDHSQGPVYAWDGIGVFTYGGNDYLGVGGYATIEGISNSGDIQNHDIYVTLNGAGASQFADAGIRVECVDIGPALATTDLNIRGRAATLTLLWIAEDGTVVDSLLILRGKGDIVKIPAVDGNFAIKARIAPPIAAWESPPRAYYTPEDQNERFPGDSGFDYVSNLQTATVSGWSSVAELGNANVIIYGPAAKAPWTAHPLQNDVTGNVIGDDASGVVYCGVNAAYNSTVMLGADTYEEETTGVQPVGGGSAGSYLLCNGLPVKIDSLGVLRTAAGKRIVGPSQNLSKFLREQNGIASNGTAGSETLAPNPLGVNGAVVTRSGAPTTGVVYDNLNGRNVFGQNGAGNNKLILNARVSGTVTQIPYVEDVTGAAVTVNPRLQVGGSDCKLSTTGVVLSPSGRRIIPQGGDPTKEFLRIWT